MNGDSKIKTKQDNWFCSLTNSNADFYESHQLSILYLLQKIQNWKNCESQWLAHYNCDLQFTSGRELDTFLICTEVNFAGSADTSSCVFKDNIQSPNCTNIPIAAHQLSSESCRIAFARVRNIDTHRKPFQNVVAKFLHLILSLSFENAHMLFVFYLEIKVSCRPSMHAMNCHKMFT